MIETLIFFGWWLIGFTSIHLEMMYSRRKAMDGFRIWPPKPYEYDRLVVCFVMGILGPLITILILSMHLGDRKNSESIFHSYDGLHDDNF